MWFFCCSSLKNIHGYLKFIVFSKFVITKATFKRRAARKTPKKMHLIFKKKKKKAMSNWPK